MTPPGGSPVSDVLNSVVADLRGAISRIESIQPRNGDAEPEPAEAAMSNDDRIARELPDLTDQLGELTEAIVADSKSRTRFQRIVLAIVAIVAGFGLISAWGTLNIIEARGPGRAIQHAIADCVSPEGECFKQAQQRQKDQTAEVARLVAKTQVDLIACSYRPEPEYRACAVLALQGLSKPTP